ncbi:hypothetical protein O3M35_006913 [Rhynocoris fuscipes]|uniref:Transposase n=1 Tax=Rhynocoris fuscipes TaxID=488301 RepID=A0AAW1DGK1_9HEMI
MPRTQCRINISEYVTFIATHATCIHDLNSCSYNSLFAKVSLHFFKSNSPANVQYCYTLYRTNSFKVKDQIHNLLNACNHSADDKSNNIVSTAGIDVNNSNVGTSATVVTESNITFTDTDDVHVTDDVDQHTFQLSVDVSTSSASGPLQDDITRSPLSHTSSIFASTPAHPISLNSSDTQEDNPLSSFHSTDESTVSSFLKFNFRIQFNKVLSQVADTIQFQSDYIHYLLNSIKTIYKSCEFNIRYKRCNKSCSKVYLKCIYKLCRNATCTIQYNVSPDGFVDASLELFGKLNHSGEYQFRQIRGLTRQEVKETLREKSVHKYYQKTVSKTDETVLASRISPKLALVGALRKMRSEGLALDDLKKSEILCLDEFQFSSPANRTFRTYDWWHDWCFDLALKQFHNMGFGILHFDATGSVVKKVDNRDHRFLYYAGVLELSINEESETLPIIEILTVSHTSHNISSSLGKFHSYAISRGGLPFNFIITDFSWALLMASCLQFNGTSIIEYVNSTYHDVRQNVQTSRVTLKICSAHFIKIVVTDLASQIKKTNKTLKHFILGVMCNFFMNAKSYSSCLQHFKNLVIVLQSEFHTAEVSKAAYYFKVPSRDDVSFEIEDLETPFPPQGKL